MKPTDRFNGRVVFESEKLDVGEDGVCHVEAFFDNRSEWAALDYARYHAIQTVLVRALSEINAIAAPPEAGKPKQP